MMIMVIMVTKNVLPDENWSVAPSLFPLNLQNKKVSENYAKVSDFRKPQKSIRFQKTIPKDQILENPIKVADFRKPAKISDFRKPHKSIRFQKTTEKYQILENHEK